MTNILVEHSISKIAMKYLVWVVGEFREAKYEMSTPCSSVVWIDRGFDFFQNRHLENFQRLMGCDTCKILWKYLSIWMRYLENFQRLMGCDTCKFSW